MRKPVTFHFAVSLLLLACPYAFAQSSTVSDESVDARADTSEFARQLGNTDPLVRQRAAETLARLAAVEQRKLVEGYQVQEKDKKVRLALDWALYRIGKSDALFRIVRELDSSRHDQAVGYLGLLENPNLLYTFLKQGDNQPKTTAGLLEALARIGDAESLELIKPFRDSFHVGVAEAAELALDQIEKRLAQTESPLPTRPRTVGKTDQISP
jgi:HEAT repeat protein